MKGIFCHDLPVYKDINGVYCSTTLTDDLFKRYLQVVDELYVVTRVYKIFKTYEETHQERITLDKVIFIDIPNQNTLYGLFVHIPKTYKLLKKLINEVDMVFIRGGIIGLLGAKAAYSLRKAYLVEVAGCAWDEYWNHSLIGKIIAPYMEYSSKKIVKNASFAIYVTKSWLQERYPTNAIQTYASNVILKEVNETFLLKRLKKIDSVNDGNRLYVFGTTGGIDNKAKGQQYVIEAIAKLRNKYNIRYELVGVGRGKYLKGIVRKYSLEENVIFKGEMTHKEVLEWNDNLDIYIQPSMQEGLPRSLLEAMSRACPAIGSTTGGIPELLSSDNIFQRGNVDNLIIVIDRFLNSDMKSKAVANFECSKEYLFSELEERRSSIYFKYRDYVWSLKK